MRRREFIKSTSLKALTAWAGTSLFLNACHTEEDMIGEPNWIIAGSFDRPLIIPSVVSNGASLTAQFSTEEILKGRSSITYGYGTGMLGPS
jgi:hypothetical protein